jgi:hypothetical protein
MQVELSTEELDELDNLLSERLGDLKEQIYKAEVADYKTTLKRREATIVRLLNRFRALRAGSTTAS